MQADAMQIDDSFETHWRPDVTVAAIVTRDDKFLLVEEIIDGKLLLNQPAGHLEPGESLIDATARETLEETGWTIEPINLVGIYQWAAPDGREFLRFAFAAIPLREDKTRKLDTGIVQALWLKREEIVARSEQLRSPMVLANINDWLSGRRLALDAICVLSTVTEPA